MVVSRNPITIQPESILIECPTLYGRMFVTASLQDEAVIRQHRWRVIEKSVLTTLSNGSYEVATPIEAVLLGTGRKNVIRHLNGNPMDVRRDNLALPTALPAKELANVIIRKGEFAYLLVGNAQTVIIDSDQIPKVERYVWKYKLVRDKPIILTKFRVDGKVKTIQLARLVMNVTATDSRKTIYKNGDRLDNRLANLQVGYTEKQK